VKARIGKEAIRSFERSVNIYHFTRRKGRGVDHAPHLAPKLKKEQGYKSIPPLGLRDLL